MRFMMLMHPDQNVATEENWEPSVEAVEAMTRFNEDMVKAGVMLAGDGLHPTSEGARIRYRDGRTIVTDGPFAEAKEVVGGYWIIQTASKEEAIEWASRCPLGGESFIELRRIYELSEFPEEIQEAAQLSQTPPEQTAAA